MGEDAAAAADRYFSQEMDAHKEACYDCAIKNGKTQEEADNCDDGSCACAGCPFIKKPQIICLCGSTRFITQIAILAYEMEKQGAIVFGMHLLPACYFKDPADLVPDHIAEAEGVREHFDELHLRKIDLCDEVFVVNLDGYIGESCANEIAYANKIGKRVKYAEAIS